MKLSENRIKQIIREEMELMEMEMDPSYLANIDLTPLMLIPGMIAVLYATFFGSKPSSDEEALQAVRDHINKKIADVEAKEAMRRPPEPPGQGNLQRQRAKARLAKLKKQRGM